VRRFLNISRVLNLIAAICGKGIFKRNLKQLKQLGPVERVIFVCTGNICRSPYAEAFFRSISTGSKETFSRGLFTTPGKAADPTASRVAELREINLGSHTTRSFEPGEIKTSDMILVMDYSHLRTICARAPQLRKQVFYLGAFAPQSKLIISDPWGKDDHTFMKCFAQIEESVVSLLGELD